MPKTCRTDTFMSGKLTLLDQNKVIRPHAAFRLFATANTIGLGDTSGLYHGTQQINQGQISATRRASITAPSRSTRARWIAGRSSPP